MRIAALVLLLAAGCGGSKVAAGASCRTTDDCSTSGGCVSVSTGSTNCTRTGSICTSFCVADADCANVGAGMTCQVDCLLHSKICKNP